MLSLSPPEPALLTRVTTQYDQDQDRIRLAGETTAGQVQQLWLTQRLLLRLLPGLWQWLQQLPQDGVAADAIAASATADPQRHQALQEFAQQQASASLQRGGSLPPPDRDTDRWRPRNTHRRRETPPGCVPAPAAHRP